MANILVVDDEAAMLHLIERILEKDKHNVTLCKDAKNVLNFDFRKFDLILLDIMMPEINGFEVCEKIRFYVDCPIIFLTAKTQMCIRDRVMEVESTLYQCKGVEQAVVRAFTDDDGLSYMIA